MKNGFYGKFVLVLLVAGAAAMNVPTACYAGDDLSGLFEAPLLHELGRQESRRAPEDAELVRLATVFAPGTGHQGAAAKGLEASPQNIYWGDAVHNAFCSCVWDWCEYNRWSVCYQNFCYEYEC